MHMLVLLLLLYIASLTATTTYTNRVNNRLSIIRDYNILCGFMWFGLRGFNLINIFFCGNHFFLFVTRTKPLFGKCCFYYTLNILHILVYGFLFCFCNSLIILAVPFLLLFLYLSRYLFL